MECEYCGKYKATILDFRDFDGCVGSYISCRFCHTLDNDTIIKIRNEHLDPKPFFKGKLDEEV